MLNSIKPPFAFALPDPPQGAMTIDVEDWFQVENLKGVIAREQWDDCELRVQANTDRMLEMLAERNIHATFFILGWVAAKCPALCRRIADAGHEIASHGFGHDLAYHQTPAEFRADVSRSMYLIADITGHQPRGYRAPSFSIADWHLPILRELGFEYDASWFPVKGHDRYGNLTEGDPSKPLQEVLPGLYEFSSSVIYAGSRALPWGGGGYFRLLPYSLFKRGVKRIVNEDKPYIFYTHPWEIDSDQPRVSGLKASHKFRHYVGLDRFAGRWGQLLDDFTWGTVAEVLAHHRSAGVEPRRRAAA